MTRPFVRALACGALLALPARGQTVLFSDNFENGLGNWSATGLWHIESEMDVCGSQVLPFPAGPQCAYYGIPGVCDYDTGVANSGDLTLLAPIVLPASGPAASLHCWTRHQTEQCGPGNQFDLFDVQVSTNGGSSWVTVGRRCDLKIQAADVWSPRGIDLTPFLGQSILLRFHFDTVDDLFNDFRGAFVDEVELRLEAGQPFCTSICPCSGPFNDTGIGYGGMSGCTNSQAHDGELAGGGTPSVASDTVELSASNLVSRSVALLLQSDGQNQGSFAGDGLYCLTGTPLRLAVRPAPTAAVSFPAPGSPPLSVLGAIPAAGAMRHYQVIYRDPASSCTGAGFNYTNGYSITWTP